MFWHSGMVNTNAYSNRIICFIWSIQPSSIQQQLLVWVAQLGYVQQWTQNVSDKKTLAFALVYSMLLIVIENLGAFSLVLVHRWSVSSINGYSKAFLVSLIIYHTAACFPIDVLRNRIDMLCAQPMTSAVLLILQFMNSLLIVVSCWLSVVVSKSGLFGSFPR